MKGSARCFYAVPGTLRGDLWTLLHPPYTAWHLGYVVCGASLTPEMDWPRLGLTVLAFFAGTGVASHALDELHGRPLQTSFTDGQLKLMGYGGLGFCGALALAGAWMASPWVLAWAAAGCFLVCAYTLEWQGGLIHTDLGFALCWGGFPVLAAFWIQQERLSLASLVVAFAAVLSSLAQRDLSLNSRFLRRRAHRAVALLRTAHGDFLWEKDRLLSTWENPLRLLSWAVAALGLGLLLAHL